MNVDSISPKNGPVVNIHKAFLTDSTISGFGVETSGDQYTIAGFLDANSDPKTAVSNIVFAVLPPLVFITVPGIGIADAFYGNDAHLTVTPALPTELRPAVAQSIPIRDQINIESVEQSWGSLYIGTDGNMILYSHELDGNYPKTAAGIDGQFATFTSSGVYIL